MEETSLFRNYSLLLKIKNQSILNYLKPMIEKFNAAKKEDISLTNEWNNEKKKVKGDID